MLPERQKISALDNYFAEEAGVAPTITQLWCVLKTYDTNQVLPQQQ